MTYSTRCAVSNAQNSSKSGARSNELPPKKLNRGDSLTDRATTPVRQRLVGPGVAGERCHPENASIQPELHAGILPLNAARVRARAGARVTFVKVRP